MSEGAKPGSGVLGRARSWRRTKSRRKPALIEGHCWSPGAIRDNPDAAFDLFDANHDDVISVAELLFTSRKTNQDVRRRGSMFHELKLFQKLDVDGNSVISRQEFCDVVRDPLAFSDQALSAIAQLATKRAEERRLEQAALEAQVEEEDENEEEDEDADEEEREEALAAVLGVVHGKHLSRRNSERSESAPSPVASRAADLWEPGESMDVLLELYAVGVAATKREWYDVLGLFAPTTANSYVVIAGDREGRRVELATTEVRSHTLNAGWTPIRINAPLIKHLDQPYTVTAELYDAATYSLIGNTLHFTISLSDNAEAAVGPLGIMDDGDNLVGKLLGTSQWIQRGTRPDVPFDDPPTSACVTCFNSVSDSCMG